MPQPNSIGCVFTGWGTPTLELLLTIILSLEDHYPNSSISAEPSLVDGSKVVSIEGRRFLLSVTEL